MFDFARRLYSEAAKFVDLQGQALDNTEALERARAARERALARDLPAQPSVPLYDPVRPPAAHREFAPEFEADAARFDFEQQMQDSLPGRYFAGQSDEHAAAYMKHGPQLEAIRKKLSVQEMRARLHSGPDYSYMENDQRALVERWAAAGVEPAVERETAFDLTRQGVIAGMDMSEANSIAFQQTAEEVLGLPHDDVDTQKLNDYRVRRDEIAKRQQLEETSVWQDIQYNSGELMGQMFLTFRDSIAAAVVGGATGAAVGAGVGAVTGPGAVATAVTYGGWSAKQSARLAAAHRIFLIEGGAVTEELLQATTIDGRNPLTATQRLGAGAVAGSINAAFELYGLNIALGASGLKGMVRRQLTREIAKRAATPTGRMWLAQVGKRAAKIMAAETGTEVVQEMVSMVVQELTKQSADEGFVPASPEEYAKVMVDIAYKTMTGVAPFALAGGVTGATHAHQRAQAAVDRQTFLDSVHEDVSKLPLRSEAPDVLANWIVTAKRTDPEFSGDIYLDRDAVKQAVDEAGLDWRELTDAVPALARDLAEGDIVIPMEEFVSQVAGSELYNVVAPHARPTATSMSIAEQQALDSGTVDAVRQAMAALQDEEAQRAALEAAQAAADEAAIAGDVAQALTSGGYANEQEAAILGQMVAAFTQGTAQGAGVNSRELWEKVGLIVRTGTEAERAAGVDPEVQAAAAAARQPAEGPRVRAEPGEAARVPPTPPESTTDTGPARAEPGQGGAQAATPVLPQRVEPSMAATGQPGAFELAPWAQPARASGGQLPAAPRTTWDIVRALQQPAYHGTPHRFAPEEGLPFGRFRLDKMGTGEGAQMYGWGLYFAEDKALADHYRQTLTRNKRAGGGVQLVGPDGTPVTGELDLGNRKQTTEGLMSVAEFLQEGEFRHISAKYLNERIAQHIAFAYGDKRAANDRTPLNEHETALIVGDMEELLDIMYGTDMQHYVEHWTYGDGSSGYGVFHPQVAEVMGTELYETPEQAQAVIDNLQQDMMVVKARIREVLEPFTSLSWDTPGGEGSLYEVDIPDEVVEQRFIDWDAPIEDQPPAVLAAFDAAHGLPGGDVLIGDGNVSRGMDFYRALQRVFQENDADGWAKTLGDREASEWLLSQGVSGLKFFDRQSRGRQDGTRNLVVWDESAVTITHRDGEPVPATRTLNQPAHFETDAFRNWFGNSAAVDARGRPLKLYHGTTQNVSSYNVDITNPESFMGQGIYTSDSISDVNAYYARVDGPDLRTRVEQLADQLRSEVENIYDLSEAREDFVDFIVEAYDIDPDRVDEVDVGSIPYTWFAQYAEHKLIGEGPNIMPVYMSIQNPADMRPGGTVLTRELAYDTDSFDEDEILQKLDDMGVDSETVDELKALDPDELERVRGDALRELAEENGYVDEKGTLFDFARAVRNAVNELAVDTDGAWVEERILANFADQEEVSLHDAVMYAKEDEEATVIYATDEEGQYIGNQIVRDALIKMGYDGVIHEARFPGMVEAQGATHYIAFDPRQVKSAIGNTGEYSRSDVRVLNQGPRKRAMQGTANPVNGKPIGPLYRALPSEQAPPQTRIVYKLMRIYKRRPGLVFPLYARPEDGAAQGFAQGTWYVAENQRPKIGADPLAERPGLHAVVLPVFDQGKASAKGELRAWVAVEMPVVTPWTQAESDSSPVLANGMVSGITDRTIGPDESYDYKTNPSSSDAAGGWPISGSMRVVRVLDDTEVTQLLADAGVEAKPEAYLTGIDAATAERMNSEAAQVSEALRAVAGTPVRTLAQSAPERAQMRVSTRTPWGVKAGFEDINDLLQSNMHHAATVPALKSELAKWTEKVAKELAKIGTPGLTLDPAAGGEANITRVVDHIKDNLRALYNAVPEEHRAKTRQWYVGANRVVQRMAKRYERQDYQVALAMAVLSPGYDWFQNVSATERVADIWFNQQHTDWTPEMETAVMTIANKEALVLAAERVRGRRLSELTTDFDRALWIRTYDLAHLTRSFRELTPEGEFGDLSRNLDGNPSEIIPQSTANIAKAVTALTTDMTPVEVSDMLGRNHKVRNFYSNILYPESTDGEVTIDTHAVAASWWLPVGVQHILPSKNFGGADSSLLGFSGMYAMYARAHTELAAELGILPRELQSVTWEAVRELFPAAWKTRNIKKVQAIWDRAAAGEITSEEARNAIRQLAPGNPAAPASQVPAPPAVAELGDTSYPGSVHSAAGAGGAAGPGGGGDAAAGAAAGARPGVAGNGTGRVRLTALTNVSTEHEALAQQVRALRGRMPENLTTPHPSLTNAVHGVVHALGETLRMGVHGYAEATTIAEAFLRTPEDAQTLADVVASMGKGERNALDKVVAKAMATSAYTYPQYLARSLTVGVITGDVDRVMMTAQALAQVNSPQAWAEMNDTVHVRDDGAMMPYESAARTLNQPAPDAPRAQVDLPVRLGERATVINLFRTADSSSFIHEMGHTFLLMLEYAALQPSASRQMREDWATVTQWLGVGADGVVTDDMHEQWARGFERYLMEGKAPTDTLRTAFEAFAKWLTSVYRSVAALNVEMTDDIRDVMGRLLAAENAATAAKQNLNVRPAFSDAASSGMTASQWARYQKLVMTQQQDAEQNMRAKLMEEVARKNRKEYKTARTRVAAEVRAELEAMPVHRLYTHVLGRAGLDLPPDFPTGPLDGDAIEERYGKEMVDRLRANGRQRVYSRNVGSVDPDVYAALFGYESAADMLEELATTAPLDEHVQLVTDERMAQEYGELLEPVDPYSVAVEGQLNEKLEDLLVMEMRAIADSGAHSIIEKAVQDAVLSADAVPSTKEDRDNLRAAERALADAQQLQNPTLIRAAEERVRIAQAVIKAGVQRRRAALAAIQRTRAVQKSARIQKAIVRMAAEETVAAMTVRDVQNPHRLQRSIAKAQAMAEEMLAKGDTAGALEAKHRALLQMEMYRAMVDARKKTESIKRRWSRYRIPAGKWSAEYVDVMNTILGKFQFKPVSAEERNRWVNIQKWVAQREADGNVTPIGDVAQSQLDPRPFETLAVQDARELDDTLRSVVGMANLERMVRRGEEMIAHDDALALLRARVRDAHGLKGEDDVLDLTEVHPTGLMAGLKDRVGRWNAAHLQPEFMFDILDGATIDGPWKQMLFQPIQNAVDAEMRMLEEAAVKFKALMDMYPAVERGQWQRVLNIREPGVKHLTITKEMALAMALNQGNAYNKQALVDGYARYGWTQEFVDTVLAEHLNETDWKFVQGMWDWIDSYWEPSRDLQRRMTGLTPEKVPAEPVQTKYGTLRGGYYPLQFDPKLDVRVEKREAKDNVMDMFGGQWSRAMTKQGHLQERTNSGGHPPLLSLHVAQRHVHNVIHDITHREAVWSVNKLLSDEEIRGYITNVFGDEGYKQLPNWLASVASNRSVDALVDDPLAFMGSLRRNMTVTVMGLKLTTALVQPLGITQTAAYLDQTFQRSERSGALVLADALQWVYRPDTGSLRKKLDYVYERSSYMKSRVTSMDRDLHNYMQSLKAAGNADSWRARLFAHIQMMDLMVSLPTWYAGYRAGLKEFVDAQGVPDEKRAIEAADRAVRMSQGSGLLANLPRIMRQSGTVSLLTMFMTYFSAYDNMNRRAAYVWKRSGGFKSMTANMHAGYQHLMLTILPVVLSDLLLGRGQDEDDDTPWWKFWGLKLAMFPFMGRVFLRDLANVTASGYDYTLSPVQSGIEASMRTVQKARSAEDWDALWEGTAMAKGGLYLAGMVTGIVPSAQVWLTGNYLHEWSRGNVDTFSVYEMLVTGKDTPPLDEQLQEVLNP